MSKFLAWFSNLSLYIFQLHSIINRQLYILELRMMYNIICCIIVNICWYIFSVTFCVFLSGNFHITELSDGFFFIAELAFMKMFGSKDWKTLKKSFFLPFEKRMRFFTCVEFEFYLRFMKLNNYLFIVYKKTIIFAEG